jgi:uncharacterized protein YuzE
MKLDYYPETDSLYIKLKDIPSVESEEIAHNIVIDFDAEGNIVGIDIDLASQKVDLKVLEAINLPEVQVKSNHKLVHH